MTKEELEKAALGEETGKTTGQENGQNAALAGAQTMTTNTNGKDYGQNYQNSQAITEAKNYLQGVIDNKPGQYASQYDAQINSLFEQIMGRKPFTYDVNNDPRYQQYKNQYMLSGQMAMQDTIGNAAALSAGYGNSYANMVGNQAYQGYLQQMTGMIPELYAQAAARYDQEGQDMQTLLGITQGLQDAEYGKYRDTVGDWQADRAWAENNYWNNQNNALAWAEYQFALQKYLDSIAPKGNGGKAPLDLNVDNLANIAAIAGATGVLAKEQANALLGNVSGYFNNGDNNPAGTNTLSGTDYQPGTPEGDAWEAILREQEWLEENKRK